MSVPARPSFGFADIEPGPLQPEPAVAEAGKLQTVVVTAQKRSESLKEVPIAVEVLDAETLASQAAARLFPSEGGVIVNSVRPGSFADEINLTKGTVILEINKHSITDEASYRSVVSALKSGDDVAFVVRGSGAGAAAGPALATVSVYVSVPPTITGSGASAIVSDRSALSGGAGAVAQRAYARVVICLPAERFWPPACTRAVQVSGFVKPSETAAGGLPGSLG